MGRNKVDSPRVLEAIKAKHPGRLLKIVLQRGNYAKNTFLAVFEDDPHGELVTIAPPRRKKTPRTANAEPEAPQAPAGGKEEPQQPL